MLPNLPNQLGYPSFSLTNMEQPQSVSTRGMEDRMQQLVLRGLSPWSFSLSSNIPVSFMANFPGQYLTFQIEEPGLRIIQRSLNALQTMRSIAPAAKNMLCFCGMYIPQFRNQGFYGELRPFVCLKRIVDSIDSQLPLEIKLFTIKRRLDDLARTDPHIAEFFDLSNPGSFNKLVEDVIEYLSLRNGMPCLPSFPFIHDQITHLENWEAVFWNALHKDVGQKSWVVGGAPWFLVYSSVRQFDGSVQVSCSPVCTQIFDLLRMRPLSTHLVQDLITEALKQGTSRLVKIASSHFSAYCSQDSDGICRFHVVHQRIIPILGYVEREMERQRGFPSFLLQGCQHRLDLKPLNHYPILQISNFASIQWPQEELDSLVRDLIDDNLNTTPLFNEILVSLWKDKESQFHWMAVLNAAKDTSSLPRQAGRALFKLFYHINNSR